MTLSCSQEARAERRAHAQGGTCVHLQPGRPDIEPELSESSDAMADKGSEVDQDELQLLGELWSAARRGDIEALTVRIMCCP